jgi:hypothetical protein
MGTLGLRLYPYPALQLYEHVPGPDIPPPHPDTVPVPFGRVHDVQSVHVPALPTVDDEP